MTFHKIVDLRDVPTWEPSDVLPLTFEWPTHWPLKRGSELFTYLHPTTFIERGTPILTPSSLDPVHGGIRRRSTTVQGLCYQVGGDSSNLQFGDVLIPRHGGVPFLIQEQHAGSFVSEGFLALRCLEADCGRFLWALFGSRSGREFQDLHRDTWRGISAEKLNDALIPWPSTGQRNAIWLSLQGVLDNQEGFETEAAPTWWSTTDLRTTEWRFALATPNPELIPRANPLGNYADCQKGRYLPKGLTTSDEEPGLLPIADLGNLSGAPYTRWTERTKQTVVALPGDILVSAVGDHARAQLVEEPVVVDNMVIRVRPHNREWSRNLAAYLNHQTGYAHRQLLLRGSALNTISVRDLSSMGLPAGLLDEEPMVAPSRPMADELEAVLWTS